MANNMDEVKHYCYAGDLTYIVGTYSFGKLSVVKEIKRQVLPTAPSPTVTHLIARVIPC